MSIFAESAFIPGPRRRGATRRLALLAAVFTIWTVPAFAGRAEQKRESYSGQNDFQVFCSSCHGVAGKGDGTLAGSLRKRPSDLTKLAQRNDGSFPTDIVNRIIDGRKSVAGHLTPDMPAWSDVFARSRESDGLEAAGARVDALVKYLESLQEKAER
jgi:mono/diheme cytochrome c family protein